MAPGMATIPTIATCSRITVRFECVKKLGLIDVKTRPSTTRATRSPPLW